jgi:hypothetical protein
MAESSDLIAPAQSLKHAGGASAAASKQRAAQLVAGGNPAAFTFR